MVEKANASNIFDCEILQNLHTSDGKKNEWFTRSYKIKCLKFNYSNSNAVQLVYATSGFA